MMVERVRGEGKDREDGKRERIRVRVRGGECVNKHGRRNERIEEKEKDELDG